MTRYIMRLDDASDYMDVEKWDRMKVLLDKYGVKPVFGIIPDNKDQALVNVYERDEQFWKKMIQWIKKGWIPALHGFEHCYVTECGGINPINARSEFAGLTYEEQCEKIEKGYEILKKHGILPEIFFAPSHTFDENTLKALKEKTEIRVVSDTIANDVYKKGDFWFIPQQSGTVRELPFKTVTFCYHPNMMEDKDYEVLEAFLKNHKNDFVCYHSSLLINRKFGLKDFLLKKLYFMKRKLRA